MHLHNTHQTLKAHLFCQRSSRNPVSKKKNIVSHLISQLAKKSLYATHDELYIYITMHWYTGI